MRYTEAAVDAPRRRTTATADTSPEDLPARNRPYLWRSSRLQHEAAVLCCVVTGFSCKTNSCEQTLDIFLLSHYSLTSLLVWHTPPTSNWPLSSGAYKFSFSRSTGLPVLSSNTQRRRFSLIFPLPSVVYLPTTFRP